MPYVLITKFMDGAFYHDPLAYRDIFASDFAADADAKAKAAAMEMRANPMCIAWSWSDSTSWNILLTRKTRGTDYVSFMRNLAPAEPGRERYTAFLRQRYQDIVQHNAAYGTHYNSFAELAQADFSKLDLQRAAILADYHEFCD